MSVQIPLEAGTELHIQSHGGRIVCTVEETLGRGGSCIVYRGVDYSDPEHPRTHIVKEFYPRAIPSIERRGKTLTVSDQDCALFSERRDEFARGISKYSAYYEDNSDYTNPRPFLYGTDNGTVYAVSDPSKGQVLSTVEQDSLSLYQIAQIMYSLCAAIQRFHSAGLLYLDCKPENIFLYELDGHCHIRLFDFDTVVSLEDIRTGKDVCICYSDGWAPMEQRNGWRGDLGKEADIYAVGAVFFSLLTGEPPGSQRLWEIEQGLFRWFGWSSLLDDLPERSLGVVRRIISHTLQNAPANRYADIACLQADFQELCALTEGDAVRHKPVFEKIDEVKRSIEALEGEILACGSLESISSAALKKALVTEREKLRQREEEYFAADKAYQDQPSRGTQELLDIAAQALERQKEQIQQLRKDMISNLELVNEYWRSGDERDIRERKAVEAVARGDYGRANYILRDPDWKEDIQSMDTMLEDMRGRCRQYISGQKLLISNLRATGVDQETGEEISRIYGELSEMAEKYQIEYSILYDYASFLYTQHDYPGGIKAAKRLDQLYELRGPDSEADWAKLDILLGQLHYGGHLYEDAASFYTKAAELFQKNPQEHAEEQIQLYNSMADLFWRQNLTDEAADRLEAVLALLESRPVSKDSLRAKAHAYTRLATLANRKWWLDEAEQYHRDAIRILDKLFSEDPANDELLQDLGKMCSNLGIVCRRQKHYDDSEYFFRRSCQLRKERYVANQSKFALGYAISCSNYSQMLACVNRLDEAEDFMEKALPIKEELMRKNSYANEATYGFSLNVYGLLLSQYDDPEHLECAETMFQKALEFLTRATERDPSSNDLGECYDNYAALLEKLDRPEEAIACIRKALTEWNRLNRRNPRDYAYQLAADYAALARLLTRGGSSEKAAEAYRQSLNFSGLVMEKSAVYVREEHMEALKGLLALLSDASDRRDEARELEAELAAWAAWKG